MAKKFGLKRKLEGLPYREVAAKRDELAEAMGISRSRLHQIMYAESDSNTNITGDQLLAAARVLDCTTDDLLHPSEEGS